MYEEYNNGQYTVPANNENTETLVSETVFEQTAFVNKPEETEQTYIAETYCEPEPVVKPESVSKPEKKKKGITAGKIVALALCCSLIGGIIGAGGMAIGMGAFKNGEMNEIEASGVLEGEREPVVIEITNVDTGKLMTASELYAANVNSTVGITTQVTTNYFGYQTTTPASGSGFIYTDDGYILTNFHVIQGASTITVTMYDGTEYNAVLIGYDESNDIAVLKIEASGLKPVIIGDSDMLNVGDSVVAIGNPLGELTFSLTSGAISALDRQVTMQNNTMMTLIQTDCAINSGNSGGALFNMYGEVVGITNAKYSSNGYSASASIDNIGFAIPMTNVRGIIDDIIKQGYTTKPYVGISVGDVSQELQNFGLPEGALIASVVAGSPAEKAGLMANDIVTAADNEVITSSQELVAYVQGKEIGDEVVFTVYRKNQIIDITITIGEQIQSAMNHTEVQQEQSQQGSLPNGFDFNFGD